MTLVVQIRGSKRWPAEKTAKLMALVESKAKIQTMEMTLDEDWAAIKSKLKWLGIEYPPKPPKNPTLKHKCGKPVNYASKNEQYNNSWKERP
jgi:hypothetical protein